MRLTSDLIQAAPSYVNTLKGRELDLRGKQLIFVSCTVGGTWLTRSGRAGNKIPFIENLGATQVKRHFIRLYSPFSLQCMLCYLCLCLFALSHCANANASREISHCRTSFPFPFLFFSFRRFLRREDLRDLPNYCGFL